MVSQRCFLFLLILITIFGLLLLGIMHGCIVTIDLVTMVICVCITSACPSRGIASFICIGCVGSTERARIDVSSEDIDSLLLSLFVLIPIHVSSTE
jgi:hypothetical protein